MDNIERVREELAQKYYACLLYTSTFFHHGIDFSVNHYLLSAVATGTVSAIGSDAEHEIGRAHV